MSLRFFIAQINLTVGDFAGNTEKIISSWQQADLQGADIIVFPELTVCGYDPKDLVLRKSFRSASAASIDKLRTYSLQRKSAAIIGALREDTEAVCNSAFVLHNGDILHIYDKLALPNYSVFDEKRLFTAGDAITSFSFCGQTVVVMICEDIWIDANFNKAALLAPDYISVLNASPFNIGKTAERCAVLKRGSKICNAPIIYTNLIGTQDSVIFDGGSMVFSAAGELVFQAPFFTESNDIIDFATLSPVNIPKNINIEEQIYQALMLSLRDYTAKNNLSKIVLGLSGGIDSAITAAIAIDALGRENVRLVTLPSRYNSSETFEDCKSLLHILGKNADEISIEPIFSTILDALVPHFSDKPADLTEENIQSRIRGLILMALSNKFGEMLLSTGNKSELAVGYATLYGDMNGGYNLLKDLYKTQIYALAKWRNNNFPQTGLGSNGVVIPDSILTKAPSAELSHGQKDSDSLPDYPILDDILYRYIDQGETKTEILSAGHKIEDVDKVLKLIKIGEFKRNQATLGPKISGKSFDLDWRYPITNKFGE